MLHSLYAVAKVSSAVFITVGSLKVTLELWNNTPEDLESLDKLLSSLSSFMK